MATTSAPGAETTPGEAELEGDLDEGDEGDEGSNETDAAAAADAHETQPTAAPEQERGPFSFISWLRRSQAEKTEEHPPAHEAPEHDHDKDK
jgi:hypothetical protein